MARAKAVLSPLKIPSTKWSTERACSLSRLIFDMFSLDAICGTFLNKKFFAGTKVTSLGSSQEQRPNTNFVSFRYTSPGRSTAYGKCLWFGASGKFWVSKQMPENRFGVYTTIAGWSVETPIVMPETVEVNSAANPLLFSSTMGVSNSGSPIGRSIRKS